MARPSPRSIAALCAMLLLVGCAGQGPRSTSTTGESQAARPPQTLVIAFRYESPDLSLKIPNPIAGTAGAKWLFNATLTALNHANISQPFLAEAQPQLNTDSWRVLPDGNMETTYRLKLNLTWHDGEPLTAEDFVLAAQVYAEPGIGVFSPSPQQLVQEVLAPDAQTVVVRWRSAYADADILSDDFPPLPRHILGKPFADYRQAGDPDLFVKHPYWATGYVGAGPYRLQRWDPGVALYGEAFDAYVLGRPKLDRIIVRYFGDENAVMVNVLSGEVQYAANTSMRFEHAVVLQREWASSHAGIAENWPQTAVTNLIQFRPEYQRTPALLDLRVRRALAHSIDKQGLQDGLFEGQGVIAHTAISPDEGYYREVERVLTKYEYDPRRTEGLMNEAGFFKDRDGFYASAAGERFRPDFMVLQGTSFERHQAIMVETWARAGIETAPSVLAPAQSRIVENRHTFPGMGHSMASAVRDVGATSREIGTAENRWTGNNREGWSNPEYDRLWDTYSTTLARSERERYLVQLAKLVTEQVPAHILYYDLRPIAYTSALSGPKPVNPWWSVHHWDLK